MVSHLTCLHLGKVQVVVTLKIYRVQFKGAEGKIKEIIFVYFFANVIAIRPFGRELYCCNSCFELTSPAL